MFCHNCGKEIHDGVNFCPHCGKTQNLTEYTMKDKLSKFVDKTILSAKAVGNKINDTNDDTAQTYAGKAKELAQKVTDTAVSSVKSIGEKVNEATDGNAQAYADKAKETALKVADTAITSAKNVGEKVNEATDGKVQVYADIARETAQDFANDVQQVALDKDTSNFFKKNNNRNGKIIVGLIAIFALLFVFFGRTPKGFDVAKELAEKDVASRCSKVLANIKSSDIDLIGHRDDGTYYILITVEIKTKNGKDSMLHYAALVDEHGDIKSFDKRGMSSEDKMRKNLIRNESERIKSHGFDIK